MSWMGDWNSLSRSFKRTDSSTNNDCGDPGKLESIVSWMGDWNSLSRSFNPVVTIAFFKVIVVVIISLSLSDWWAYADNPDDVVESCANPETECYSFCDTDKIVSVQFSDDDYMFDDEVVPPNKVINSHESTSTYCIAELMGACAYKYWMIFKLVPLLLHILSLILQFASWRISGNFAPQQVQYDIMLMFLYPEHKANFSIRVSDFDHEHTFPGSVGDGDVDGDGDGIQPGCVSGAVDSASNSTGDEDGTFGGEGWTEFKANRIEMINWLRPGFTNLYNVFAFLEVLTALYVWGELMFPSTYCGDVRPLSLYYYPILMSLAELIKLNLYVATRYAVIGSYSRSLFALFNLELLWTNLWMAVVLAAWFGATLLWLLWDGARWLALRIYYNLSGNWPEWPQQQRSEASMRSGHGAVELESSVNPLATATATAAAASIAVDPKLAEP